MARIGMNVFRIIKGLLPGLCGFVLSGGISAGAGEARTNQVLSAAELETNIVAGSSAKIGDGSSRQAKALKDKAGEPESPSNSETAVEDLGFRRGPDLQKFQASLEAAQGRHESKDLVHAERAFIQILESHYPDALKRPVLLELGIVMQ